MQCMCIAQSLGAASSRTDRLASRLRKELNTTALRRKPTVMPDSTISPGNPAALRDPNRRTSEQGVETPRHISPGEALAPAAGTAHARRPALGAAGRAQRAEPRWRDIQWVDFTSDVDSGAAAPPLAAAPPPSESASRASELPRRQAPAAGFGNSPRRFGAPPAPAADTKHGAIPGLAPRFTRLPVSRSALLASSPPSPPLQSPRDRLAAMPKDGSVVVHPRLPLPGVAAAPPEPKPVPEPPAVAASEPLPEPRAQPSLDAAPEEAEEFLFPASITTPVSTAPPPREPTPPARWRAALSERAAGAGAALRGVSVVAATSATRSLARASTAGAGAALRGASVVAAATATRSLALATTASTAGAGAALRSVSVATAATRNFARAATVLRPRGPAAPARPGGEPGEQPPASRSALIMQLTNAIDTMSRYVAAKEHRLRVSGMVALAVVVVALAAYSGGARLAALTGTRAGTASTGTASAAAKQPPFADKAAHAPQAAIVPAPPPSNVPPTDPAARAAFYMARAKVGDPAAQYDVGVLYARGAGLVQDYASAATWLHAAAAQGNIAAEYNLGVLYERGLGVATNQTEALNWYRSAADQNHPGAQFNLALAYAGGDGVKQDFATAARWYQRAAGQGLAPAMVNLAILYERGSGVDRSPIDAYAWYSAAGERGDGGAKQRAGELFQQFSDRDKARAESLAATIGAALDAPSPPA